MTLKGSICAACGQPAHRYGRNEGIERFNPQACINGLLGRLEAPPSGFVVCDECEGGVEWPTPRFTDPHPLPVPCLSCRGSGLRPTDELRHAAADVLADHLDDWNDRHDIRDVCDPSKIARTPRRNPELMAEVDTVLRVVAEHLGGRQ